MKQAMYKKVVALAMVLLAVNFVFAFATPALGADANDLWGNQEQKDYVKNNSGLPTEVNDPRQVVVQIIKILLGFLGILAVIIVLYAGFTWMTAGGNEESVEKAKKMLTAGIIGLIIIISAYAIADFVITTLYDATANN